MRHRLLVLCCCLALGPWVSAWAAHAYAQFGDVKYPAGFAHFAYAAPDAPKGGRLRLPMIGASAFDKLNPFTLKGTEPPALEGLLMDTLLVRSLDEPATAYGLLAEDVQVAPDGRSAVFTLNPLARFHNGDPVLAEDVRHSFLKLTREASPVYRIYFSPISAVEVLGERRVRFDFKQANREYPLIAGNLPVFSRRWGQNQALDTLQMSAPIGSGPYRLGAHKLGQSIRFERDPNYWARDLNVMRGQNNFERIELEAYKDPVAAFEAFKADEFDFIQVYVAKDWARKYKGGGFDRGELIKQEWPHANAVGFQGYHFNTRRPHLADPRVRQAIGLAMDYEWMNRQIFYGAYARVRGYFSNSPFEAKGLPDEAEQALLRSLGVTLPPALLTQPVPVPPRTDGDRSLRDNLRQARDLLAQAGWQYRDGALRNASGQVFAMEFLDASASGARVVAPLLQQLAKLGIRAQYRQVDPSVYEKRVKSFEFDVISSRTLGQLTPGSELMRYASRHALEPGSPNLTGVRDPVVDALIERVQRARDRDELTLTVRSLDRVLRHLYLDVPHWYSPVHRVAYRAGRFAQPPTPPLYYQAEAWAMSTWWSLPQPVPRP